METIGHSSFEAGISNQKLALLGLALAALETRRAVSIPDIRAFPNFLGQSARAADSVFCVDGLRSAFATLGVEVAGFGNMPGDPEPYFLRATETIVDSKRAGDQAGFDRCAGFLARLRPNAELWKSIENGQSALKALGVDTACQMRIERDWIDHVSEARSRFGEKERADLSAAGILAKIRQSMPDASRLYVTVDMAQLDMSPSDFKAFGEHEGFELITREDILAASLHSQIDGSLFDFEIATGLANYVGNTRSTFFNVATISAYGRKWPGRFWAYNNASSQLRLRTDHGAYPRPSPATMK